MQRPRVRRKPPEATAQASCTIAGWLMVWMAAAIVVVGLLVPGGVNFGAASGVALLAGVPVTLTFLGALTSPGQAVAIALLLATLYGLLARGIWQGSTIALGLSLVLLLGDLGWGVLTALGVSGEVPPGLVVLLAAVFFGPRLGLMWLLGQCLSQKRNQPTALKIGALARGLSEFLVDPVGWVLYRFGQPSPPDQNRDPPNRD
ncbi:hypothetical protein IQ254_25040 [Nodosilinea sp. LEGE 07088]|uniref:hypothetical protein n=1 Tax=Nodosilinea sp. LEGE 07088 TaxID=2777968 RepID=UPI00187F98CC|nr:hypothetical protein [Nodosilinea sp. LEGE 07088]MBE9140427.1 hypothetical protein [Nodosilinea sp. LEGE 07088]